MKDTMKKTYVAPRLDIAYVGCQAMMAASPDRSLGVSNEPTSDPGRVNENSGYTDIWGNDF